MSETEHKLGTVITTPEGPSVSSFSFLINQVAIIKRGQFISVETEDGLAIATVSNIFKTNRYFESAGAVNEHNKTSELYSAFPVKEWEYTIGEAHILGAYDKNEHLVRPSYPPSPGKSISSVDTNVLSKFLGLDEKRGVHLGQVQQHELDAKFNMTKLLQKHLAILAISGAGKSYATTVLIEELVNRGLKDGRIAIIVIDNHGEYESLKNDAAFKDKITIIDAREVKVGCKHMTGKAFAALLPHMTSVQIRELNRIIYATRKKEGAFDLTDLIESVKVDEAIGKSTSEALIGWLSELEAMKVFAGDDYPNIEDFLQQGKVIVVTLKDILSLNKKQFVVDYISKRLFDLRRREKVPPYLEIIEEAHNFCPEGAKSENALSRKIIETLAREGRKFYANICLISQRPVQLSTTALSQCNTQIIMRVTNPYDLDHIKKSAEAISSGTLDIISSLKVGEAVVIGEAANHPVFIKIRERKTKESHGTKLEDYAILWEAMNENSKLANGKEFL